MPEVDDVLLDARARLLRDLEATASADPDTVSRLEEAIAGRRWWAEEWDEGPRYVAGLVAQDLQDRLLDSRGRWPVCPLCDAATHALYIHPELGGPDPRWTCEETGREVAALGELPATPRPGGAEDPELS